MIQIFVIRYLEQLSNRNREDLTFDLEENFRFKADLCKLKHLVCNKQKRIPFKILIAFKNVPKKVLYKLDSKGSFYFVPTKKC